MNLKVYDGKLALYGSREADSRPGVLTIPKTGGQFSPKSYSFREKSQGTAFTGCEVSYRDPNTQRVYSYAFDARGNRVEKAASDAQKVWAVNQRVESEADARELAQNALRNKNGGQEPLWVEWDWLMQYERFRRALAQLLQPDYLFSELAKANLTSFLRMSGAFEGEGKVFDHISLPWRMWRRRAIQGKTLHLEIESGFNPLSIPVNVWEVMDKVAWEYNHSIKPDGFQCAIADTTLYALCAVRTVKK